MKLEHLPEFLLEHELFDGMSTVQVHNLVQHFTYRRIKRGQVLYNSNSRASSIYLMLSGRVSIHPPGRPAIQALSGDLIGETALLTGQPHSSDARAQMDSEVLSLSRKGLDTAIQRYPRLAINLGVLEAKRLRNHLNRPGDDRQPVIIAHLGLYDGIECHYLALNLAAAIAAAQKEEVAFLHFSRTVQTPFESLNFRVTDNRLQQALDSLRRLKKPDLNRLIITQKKTSLALLPSLPGQLPVDLVKSSDISRLLSALSDRYHYVFMDLGSQDLNSGLARRLIDHATVVLTGIKADAESLKALRRDRKALYTNIERYPSRNIFYINHLMHGQAPLTPARLEHLEEVLRRPADFVLEGDLYSAEDYLAGGLQVLHHQSSRSAVSMRRLGRWIAGKSRGLALGGGGARALSHIGVMREFEKAGIVFDAVSGTSMGSLIGAQIAMGLSSHEIETNVRTYLGKDSRVLDYGLPFVSFFRGYRASNLLKKFFGNLTFEELKLPFSCVAVDLISGKEVVLNSGPVWKAVRASMSLPVIFPPVRYAKYLLVDGGVLNNVPGDVLKRNRVNYVCGVNCTPLTDQRLVNYLEETRLESLLKQSGGNPFKSISLFFKKVKLLFTRPPILEIAFRTLVLEGRELMRYKSSDFDFMLKVEGLEDIGFFQFERVDDCIAAGQLAAREQIKQLKKIFC